MKKGKLSVLAVAAIGACCGFAAVGCANKGDDAHTHEFGNWAITEYPTSETGGKITRTCTANDGGVETVDIPALSDTEFWTVQSTVPANHTTAERITYANATYNINYTVDGAAALGHTWGKWDIKEGNEPTEESGGKIECKCTADDGGVKTQDVPKLKDDSFWTVQTNAAGHAKPGSSVYSNAEYAVTYTVNIPAQAHTFGDWAFATENDKPTADKGGKITRTCTADDGGVETKNVPKLTDSTFWTAGAAVAPGHTTVGTQTFTNAAHKLSVTVTTPAVGHTWSDWAFVDGQAATVDAAGKITRTCSAADGGVETKDVPKLSDTTFWNKSTVTADYNTAGYDVYTPKDTSIEFETRVKTTDKVAAPYDNKTYYPLAYELANSDNLNDTISVGSSWSAATLALKGDNANTGIGTGYPYQNTKVTVEMVDASIGKVKLTAIEMDTSGGEPVVKPGAVAKEYVGYVNMDADKAFIVYQDEDKKYFLLTPYTYTETLNIYEDDQVVDTKDVLHGYSAGTKASAWTFTDDNGFTCKGLAVNYKYGEEADKVINFYLEEDAVSNFRVYFGAKFEDKKESGGNVINADHVYNSSAAYVKTSDGTVINAFGYNGTLTNRLDGLQGAYSGTLEEGGASVTLTLDGLGGFTGKTGSYYEKAAAGSSYTLDAYIDGAYYELTLAESNFTAVKPMVTITFVHGGDTPDTTEQYNKNIAVTIPDETGAGFMGWFFDKDYTQKVPASFVPTENDTIYARWSKTFINIQVESTGEPIKVHYNERDKFEDLLPEGIEEIDVDNNRYLAGWFTQADGQGTQVNSAMTFAADDSGATIYAYWQALPAYYGDFYGVEIWAQTQGNYNNLKSASIDISNALTGSKSGTITNYDAATQKITWTSGSSTYAAWYDADSGIFVLNNTNKSYMTDDIYVMSKYNDDANFKLNKFYGIQTAPPEGSGKKESERGYYAKVVNMKINATDSGNVLFYNNRIYVDVTITNTKGETLAVDAIKNSKDVVIKDKFGATVLAVSSKGANFGKNGDTVDLDAYYGTYNSGDKSVTLDGAGGLSGSGLTMPTDLPEGSTTTTGGGYYEDTVTTVISYEALAKYIKRSDGAFDVYVYVAECKTVTTEPSYGGSTTKVEDPKVLYNVAYYKMTLNTEADTYTLEKVMATLTDGTANTTLSTSSFNVNIAMELPTPTNSDATKIFRGWFTDAECKVPVTLDNGKYTFTEDVTLYSKWEQKVTLSIYYNAATATGAPEDKVVDYAIGDTVTVDNPVSDAMKFDGWYTDPTFAVGSEWTSGAVISANTVIYAKWSPAPAYYNTYTNLMEIGGTSANGGVTSLSSRSPKFSIDADGVGTLITSSWPINKDISITGYDEADGTLIFNLGTSKYRGFLDKDTGVLIINDTAGETADIKELWFFAPFDGVTTSSNYKSSYWNGGKTRAIQFTTGGTTYSYFIDDNKIYAGATFKTAASGGEDVAANACYNANELYVTATGYSASFGYNGTTMVKNDGYGATYTDTGSYGSVVVNGYGTVTIGGKDGNYSAIVDNKLTTVIDGVYYEVTLDKASTSCTVVAPTATATFVFDNATATLGDAAVTSNTGMSFSTNVAFQMPTITANSGYQFVGWYEKNDYSGDAVTEYTFTEQGAAKTFYAKVQEAPKWSSKDTAEEIVFNSDGKATVSGETTVLNMKYWAKLTVTEAGVYAFKSGSSAVKTGGTGVNNNDPSGYKATSGSYGRYSIVKADGSLASDSLKTLQFGSYSWTVADLAVGTYYIEAHIGGNVTGSTTDYDVCGSFSIDVVKAEHGTTGTAIDYTLGTTADTSSSVDVKNGINVYYKVHLTVGTYKLTNSSTASARIDLLKYNSDSTNVYANKGTSVRAKITQEGDYYLKTSDACVFKLETLVLDGPFDGNTYKKEESGWYTTTYTVKFTSGKAGTITIDEGDEYGSNYGYPIEHAFTATYDETAKTVTFKIDGKADIVATYTDTSITFPSECSISEIKGKTLNIKN